MPTSSFSHTGSRFSCSTWEIEKFLALDLPTSCQQLYSGHSRLQIPDNAPTDSLFCHGCCFMVVASVACLKLKSSLACCLPTWHHKCRSHTKWDGNLLVTSKNWWLPGNRIDLFPFWWPTASSCNTCSLWPCKLQSRLERTKISVKHIGKSLQRI